MNKGVKPTQPPCEGGQFDDSPITPDNYYSVVYNKWNNEIAKGDVNHDEMPMEPGRFGSRMFADSDNVVSEASKLAELHPENGGPADGMTSSRIFVDVSRADRGKEA